MSQYVILLSTEPNNANFPYSSSVLLRDPDAPGRRAGSKKFASETELAKLLGELPGVPDGVPNTIRLLKEKEVLAVCVLISEELAVKFGWIPA